jgi:hypothetical protein
MGGNCGIVHTTTIPMGSLVNNLSTGEDRAIDEEKGAKLSCSIRGRSISATIAQGLETITITGTADESSGTATISHFDPDASQSLKSTTNGCALTVHRLESDVIWASFACEAFNAPPTHACRADGTFLFENCE